MKKLDVAKVSAASKGRTGLKTPKPSGSNSHRRAQAGKTPKAGSPSKGPKSSRSKMNGDNGSVQTEGVEYYDEEDDV